MLGYSSLSTGDCLWCLFTVKCDYCFGLVFYNTLSPYPPQKKYKELGRKSVSSSIYSQLPDTAEIQLAKAIAEVTNEVSPEYGFTVISIYTHIT